MAQLPQERREAIELAQVQADIDLLLTGQSALSVTLDTDGLPHVVAIDLGAPGADRAVMLRGHFENDRMMVIDDLIDVDYASLEARVLAHMPQGNAQQLPKSLSDMLIGRVDTFKLYESPMEVWEKDPVVPKVPKNKHGVPWYHGKKRRY